jgi:hypothetical protein
MYLMYCYLKTFEEKTCVMGQVNLERTDDNKTICLQIFENLVGDMVIKVILRQSEYG